MGDPVLCPRCGVQWTGSLEHLLPIFESVGKGYPLTENPNFKCAKCNQGYELVRPAVNEDGVTGWGLYWSNTGEFVLSV